MFTRLVIVMLMVTLALPMAALTPPNPTSDAPWGANVVTAKAKKQAKNKNKKKKKRKKQNKELPPPTTPTPTPTTVTRTVRGTVTETFSSADAGLGPMTIPGGAPGTTKGNANPYPSALTVSGFANGVITDVDLVLQDFSHPVPEDVDILLVAPDGRRALVMSDAGRIFRVTNIDLTLDDEAAAPLTQMELDSGVYRPTDFSSAGDVPDAFPTPAPALDGRVALSAFDGADPNGTWQLFVVDDASGDAGDLRGWVLRITAEVDTGTVEEPASVGRSAIQETEPEVKEEDKGKDRGKRRR